MRPRVKKLLIPLFTALTALGAFIQVPWYPIPFTLQLFFTYLSGFLISAKSATFSQVLYVVIGLVGLPIFAGGKGGVSVVFSPTFGYILAFPLAAFITGTELTDKPNLLLMLLKCLVALIVVYTVGVTYLHFYFNFILQKTMSLTASLQAGVIPFIIPDLIKCCLAAFIGLTIKERVPFID